MRQIHFQDKGGRQDVLGFLRVGGFSLPFADLLLAADDTGFCWAGFALSGDEAEPMRRLQAYFSGASLVRDDAALAPAGRWISAVWAGRDPGTALSLSVYGTPFQVRVWRALMAIPMGGTCSYGALAAAAGSPRAAQAVGQAVGANPISLVIPCHRVIQASGDVRNYGWGDALKIRLLDLEGGLISPSGRPTRCASG